MDSLSTKYVKDTTGLLEIATSTDERDAIVEALSYSPEESEMQRAQERMERPKAKPLSREERHEEARRMIPNFDRDTFRNVTVYQGVLDICNDHPAGYLLANKLATDPRLRRELLEMKPHLAMAKAGSLADRLRDEGSPHRKPAFADIME
jgi:hypothetical protein